MLILLYHRIACPDTDPQRLAVHPDRFAAHLRVVRDAAEVMSLTELLAARADRRLPGRGLVLTFDDGYADNGAVAAPLLDQAGVPATFFVTTSVLDGGREFWWDELEQHLLGPGVLPDTLRLTIAGSAWTAALGAAASWSEAEAAGWRGWTVEEPDPTPRHTAYRRLCGALKPLAGDARRRVLDALAAQAGRPSAVRETHRAMTAAEVGALSRRRGLDVGSHTVTHPSLAALPADARRAELHDSRATLAALTGGPVEHLAYPFGGRGDHSWRTRRAARAAGYTAACANEPGVVRSRTSPFRLPRMLVRDWDGPALAGRLERWFDG
ncbi:MAG: polysaccharide deacetylase family protein [Alphaproteobacteria bacterium]